MIDTCCAIAIATITNRLFRMNETTPAAKIAKKCRLSSADSSPKCRLGSIVVATAADARDRERVLREVERRFPPRLARPRVGEQRRGDLRDDRQRRPGEQQRREHERGRRRDVFRVVAQRHPDRVELADDHEEHEHRHRGSRREQLGVQIARDDERADRDSTDRDRDDVPLDGKRAECAWCGGGTWVCVLGVDASSAPRGDSGLSTAARALSPLRTVVRLPLPTGAGGGDEGDERTERDTPLDHANLHVASPFGEPLNPTRCSGLGPAGTVA